MHAKRGSFPITDNLTPVRERNASGEDNSRLSRFATTYLGGAGFLVLNCGIHQSR